MITMADLKIKMETMTQEQLQNTKVVVFNVDGYKEIAALNLDPWNSKLILYT
jgi:glutamine synthetase type III